jgi:hypothetical protein
MQPVGQLPATPISPFFSSPSAASLGPGAPLLHIPARPSSALGAREHLQLAEAANLSAKSHIQPLQVQTPKPLRSCAHPVQPVRSTAVTQRSPHPHWSRTDRPFLTVRLDDGIFRDQRKKRPRMAAACLRRSTQDARTAAAFCAISPNPFARASVSSPTR